MYNGFIKRVLDIIISALCIIILLPVYIALSVTVLISLGRPVLFLQPRPGKDNKIFRIIKFRTMTPADGEGDADGRDGRITKAGHFLRKTFLDETPEFINILLGHMSLVGPRPQLIEDMVFFSEEIMRRQTVTPGLTGLAQAQGKRALMWDEKFRYDLMYIRKITFFGDCRIALRTALLLFKKEEERYDTYYDAGDYGQYLLKKGLISKEQYEQGMRRADIIAGRGRE